MKLINYNPLRGKSTDNAAWGADSAEKVDRATQELTPRRAAGRYPRVTVTGSRRECHLGRLKPFRSLEDVEVHGLSLLKRSISIHPDGGIVHEHVPVAVLFDEPVTFRLIEPLHFADEFHRKASLWLSHCYWRTTGTVFLSISS